MPRKSDALFHFKIANRNIGNADVRGPRAGLMKIAVSRLPSASLSRQVDCIMAASLAWLQATRSLTPTTTVRGVRQYSAVKSFADEQMRMLIVGSPGSGKGTQSAKLLSRYDFSVISAGDVLRAHIQRKTEIGNRAATVIQQGGLMPDEIMMSLIGSEVAALSTSWLLDGFPRTLGQAQMLDDQLDNKQQKPLKLVVNLDVPEDVILDRILQRWTHPASGRIYNLSFNPPKVAGKDDVTGEPLVQRDDDNAVSSPHRDTRRLSVFTEQARSSSSGNFCETSKELPCTDAANARALSSKITRQHKRRARHRLSFSHSSFGRISRVQQPSFVRQFARRHISSNLASLARHHSATIPQAPCGTVNRFTKQVAGARL